MNKQSILLASAALFVSTFVAAPDASALIATRQNLIQAPGACVPFAPTQNIRYTAVGLKNIGSSTFYVSCNVMTEYFDDSAEGISRVELQVANNGDSPFTITCTLRTGYSNGPSTTTGGSYPDSRSVSAGGTTFFQWNSPDATHLFGTANITCTVPANAELRYVYVIQREDVGA